MITLLRRLFLVTMSTSLLLATPAHASDELGLSRDGQTWGSSLDGPLFGGDMQWVPGDSATASFYVRNQSRDGSELAIDVREQEGDADLGKDLVFKARADDGPWVALGMRGASHMLSTDPLTGGESVRIDLNTTFNPSVIASTGATAVQMRFRVSLADAELAAGPLPSTGARVEMWMVGLGAVVTGSGVAMVARRRVRSEVTSHG